jgi:hypothetical protein
MEYMLPFPNCWDGKNLDSPDHKSHMSYPSGTLPREENGCPFSHPVRIPSITYNVTYRVTDDIGTSKWRLSSDNYSNTQPGGYSLHGDWMNGWKKEFSDEFYNNCLKVSKDCHAYLLGDNRISY